MTMISQHPRHELALHGVLDSQRWPNSIRHTSKGGPDAHDAHISLSVCEQIGTQADDDPEDE
jgi:hypothetical protein